MPIVRVGLPSVRKLSTQSIATFKALDNYDKTKIDFRICKVTGTHCMRARNISSQAVPTDSMAPVSQKLPYDFYLSTDDDMAFTPQAVERLIALNLDIVGASYMTRSGPDAHLVVACPLDKRNKDDWFKVWDRGLQEARWIGGGCMLIRKNVFESMQYPWWRNNTIFEEIEGVQYGDIQTEDLSFCEDARKAGFRVFIDLDNRIAHIPS